MADKFHNCSGFVRRNVWPMGWRRNAGYDGLPGRFLSDERDQTMSDLFGNTDSPEPKSRPRNEIWDAVCEACYGKTIAARSVRGMVSRAVADLKDMGANAFSIRKVAREWGRQNRDDGQRYMTPVTLMKCYAKYCRMIEDVGHVYGQDYEEHRKREVEKMAMLRLNGWPH